MKYKFAPTKNVIFLLIIYNLLASSYKKKGTSVSIGWPSLWLMVLSSLPNACLILFLLLLLELFILGVISLFFFFLYSFFIWDSLVGSLASWTLLWYQQYPVTLCKYKALILLSRPSITNHKSIQRLKLQLLTIVVAGPTQNETVTCFTH